MNRLTTRHRPHWLSLVSTLSLGLAAGQALAEPPPGVPVSYADLDLSKQAGAEALYDRIRAAARSACGRGGVDARDIERFTLFRTCYEETIQAALKRVNHKGLYAVHEQRTEAPASG